MQLLDVQILLKALDHELVSEWQEAFADCPSVHASQGDRPLRKGGLGRAVENHMDLLEVDR